MLDDGEMSHTSSHEESSSAADLHECILTKSHLEVEMVVLAAVREGASSMELLRTQTNLPWSVLSETAGSLLKAGFLTVEDGSQTPRLNLKEKAFDLIERYRGILDRIATAKAVIEIGPG